MNKVIFMIYQFNILLIFFIIFCNNLFAQFVNSGTNIKCVISAAGVIRVDGNLKNINSASFINNGQIDITNDFYNDATSTFTSGGSSKIKFCGTSLQKVEFLNGIFNLNDVEINNSNGVDLLNDVEISGTMTLTSGIIRTYNSLDNPYTLNTLSFSTNADNPSESTNSYILGEVKMNSRNIGTGQLDFIGFKIYSGADDLGNVEIIRTNGNDGIIETGSYTSIACNWVINADNQPASGRNLELLWLSDFDNNKDLANIIIYKSESPYTIWDTSGTLQDVTGNNPRIASSGTTSFSKWAPSDKDNPLPIELLSFYAVQNNTDADIIWETASEINTDYFEVLRSFNAVNFNKIGVVNASGNSNIICNYLYKDINITSLDKEVIYYQLKSIDFDGKIYFSDIVDIKLNNNTDIIELMPNPVVEHLFVNVNSTTDKTICFTIFDCIGNLIRIIDINVNKGKSQHKIDMSNLSAGIYFIVYDNSQKNYIEKIHKKRTYK